MAIQPTIRTPSITVLENVGKLIRSKQPMSTKTIAAASTNEVVKGIFSVGEFILFDHHGDKQECAIYYFFNRGNFRRKLSQFVATVLTGLDGELFAVTID